jgi:Na+/proline symporter
MQRLTLGSDLPAQAAMLIPIGIILYTVAGGLKATFISSYVHTVIIYVVLCLFSFMVYTPSSVTQLGSPSKVGQTLLPVPGYC